MSYEGYRLTQDSASANKLLNQYYENAGFKIHTQKTLSASPDSEIPASNTQTVSPQAPNRP